MLSEAILKDQDLALLASKLVTTLIVRDILEDQSPSLEDDTVYALHEEISDLQPDSALLSIALAAREIIALAAYQSASLKVMGLECDRIIGDYGPLWLKHARDQNQDQNIDETLLFDTLANIPEDLESIAELLQINADFLQGHDPKAAEICVILQVQADAHAMIAAQFIEVIDEYEDGYEQQTDTPPATIEFYTDNVIAFPFGGKAG